MAVNWRCRECHHPDIKNGDPRHCPECQARNEHWTGTHELPNYADPLCSACRDEIVKGNTDYQYAASEPASPAEEGRDDG